MILEEYPVVARDQSMLNLVHLPPCSILGHSHMAPDPLHPQNGAARQPWSGLQGKSFFSLQPIFGIINPTSKVTEPLNHKLTFWVLVPER